MWASSFIVIRSAGNHFTPGAMALLRLGSASTALLALLAARRVRLPRSPRILAGVLAWGIAWGAVYTFVLNTAEMHIDAATAAMLVNIAPLIVAVASTKLLGERLTGRLIAGLLISFSGVALIAATTSTGRLSGVGVVLGVLAALLYAGSVLAQKPLLAHIDSVSMTAIGFWAATLVCLPFAGELASGLSTAPAGAIAAVVYMGVLPTAGAFLLWGYALTHLGAGVLSSSSLVVPAVTLVLAWVLLAEVPPPLAAAGGALCLVGAGFSILPNVWRALRRG